MTYEESWEEWAMNGLYWILKSKENWTGPVLQIGCLLHDGMEGRRMQMIDDLCGKRKYRDLTAEAQGHNSRSSQKKILEKKEGGNSGKENDRQLRAKESFICDSSRSVDLPSGRLPFIIIKHSHLLLYGALRKEIFSSLMSLDEILAHVSTIEWHKKISVTSDYEILGLNGFEKHKYKCDIYQLAVMFQYRYF